MQLSTLLRVALFLAFTFALWWSLVRHGWIPLLIVGAVTWIAFRFIRWHEKRLAPQRAEERARQLIREQVAEHIDTLARKRMQLLKKNDYGAIDASAWTTEIARFIKSAVFPKMADEDLQLLQSHQLDAMATELIEAEAHRAHVSLHAELDYEDDMTPVMFEHYCASLLERGGWRCEVTRSSGDQGVDIIATKGQIKIAIQCKKYSAPVGNSAVQEISAARIHIGAVRAVVVATAGYTRSARELAATTNTLLLEHTDLTRIDELLAS